MLVIQISRHCWEQILAIQWKVKGKRAKFFCFFLTEENEFSGLAWKLSGIQYFRWGWEVHSTSQERWRKTIWRVILCLPVMAPWGVAHSQISDFLRGCRLSCQVSGSRRVLSPWLFYMQASVSWTWCERQLGASAGRLREVWHGPFWVRWRPVVPLHSESSVKVWLCMMEVQQEEHCISPV